MTVHLMTSGATDMPTTGHGRQSKRTGTDRRSGHDRRALSKADRRMQGVGMFVGLLGVLLGAIHDPGWLILALAGLAVYEGGRAN